METVTVERTVDAPARAVRAAFDDTEALVAAGGFSGVDVSGDTIRIENRLGLLEIELELAIVDRPGAVLAYEQREGIFEEMLTAYAVGPGNGPASEDRPEDTDGPTDEETSGRGDGRPGDGTGGPTTVRAWTEFALDVSLVGEFLDSTVVSRQRRRELEGQLGYVDETATGRGDW